MTDSKNIVIKVRYTPPGTVGESPASASRMITEWNIKRIVGAASVLILLIAGLSFLLTHKFQESAPRNETAPNSAPAPQPAASKTESKSASPSTEPKNASDATKEISMPSQPALSAAPAHSHPGIRIRRAELAYRISDKEPADLIGSNVSIKNGNSVQIYYFTEVRGKTDQILFHEWLKDGQLILRHPVTIGAERWRTSSQRQLGQNDQGNWSARTVDNRGTVLNQINFSVSVK